MDGVITKNIVKDFPSGDDITRVLHGVDMKASAGELTLLVGPSGCGKTTLLSIISGILSPTSGEVTVNGTNITSLSNSEKVMFRRHNVGFIFQQFNLLPSLNAAENAAIPLIAQGMKNDEAVKIAADELSKIGMGAHIKKLPSHLSGGQQQRVAIARALVHKPKLLVCDEPTSALDASTGHTVMEILRETALKPDRTVIVVTHDSRIFEFGDKIIHMSDGKVVKEEKVK